MAEMETASHSLEAVEAPQDASKKLMRRGLSEATAWRSATNGRGPLVECRGRAYEQSCSEILLRQTGAGATHRPASPTSTHFMNRRVRNGTHGGVGGRREQSRLLPDSSVWICPGFVDS